MSQFHLLNRSRQTTEFSCGPAAVQAVLRHWGHDVTEEALMELMETNSEIGSRPENIVRAVRALGLQAEMRENVTLDELQEYTSSGNPVVTLGQVWRSGSKAAEEDWDSGHYIVVLGVDKDKVYFQDPYLRMAKGFAPRQHFDLHWHQAMGGDLDDGKLVHVAIFIKGERPTRTQNEALDGFAVDFNKIGSINLLITEFPGNFLPFSFLDELRELWQSQVVRPSAFILLRKHQDGRLSAIEGGRLQDENDITSINALLAAIAEESVGGSLLVRSKAQAAIRVAAKGDFGLSTNELNRIGDRLPPDRSAIILLMENLWERQFKDAAAKYGGTVVKQRMITSETIANFGKELSQMSH